MQNQCQVVKLNNVLSDKVRIESGVSQGSTLGPFLFLIYVNDLVRMNLRGSLYSFTDDTAVVYFGKSKKKLLEKINKDKLWEH